MLFVAVVLPLGLESRVGAADNEQAGAPVAPAPLRDPQRARAHNDRGVELHRAGKYEEARVELQAAVDDDPSYALAHYNLACTLTRLWQRTDCRYDEDAEPIYALLERAIALDQRRRARARVDGDLAALRAKLPFQRRVLARDIGADDGVGAVLVDVHWYGRVQGAYGPMIELTFRTDGGVSYREKVDPYQLRPERRYRTLHGRYTVKNGAVTLRLRDGKVQRVLRGTLTWQGLDLDGLVSTEGHPTRETFNDFDSACDV